MASTAFGMRYSVAAPQIASLIGRHAPTIYRAQGVGLKTVDPLLSFGHVKLEGAPVRPRYDRTTVVAVGRRRMAAAAEPSTGSSIRLDQDKAQAGSAVTPRRPARPRITVIIGRNQLHRAPLSVQNSPPHDFKTTVIKTVKLLKTGKDRRDVAGDRLLFLAAGGLA